MVAGFRDLSVFCVETVIVLGSLHPGNLKTITDLNRLYSTYGHNCLCKNRIELLKNRISETGRNVFDPAFYDTAGTVLILHAFLQIGSGSRGCTGIRHIKGISRDFFCVKIRDLYRTDGFGVSAERNAKSFKNPGCDCTCCHAADGFTPRGTAASTVITEAIFGIKGKVGMTRAVGVSKISIIPGTLVCVAYHERDRSSGGFSLKNSGEDFYQIPFLAGSCITTLAGFAPIEKFLDIFFIKRKTGWASVYDSSKSFAVRFAPGRDSKVISKA